MTENTATLIISAIVDKKNVAELPDYLTRVMTIFLSHGGKPIARYKVTESLLGNNTPEMMAIISFPNAGIINEIINGSDFQSLGDLRSRVFTKLNMFIGTSM